MKKDVNDWDDTFNGSSISRSSQKGLDALAAKLTKVMQDSVKKATKRNQLAESGRTQQEAVRDQIDSQLQQNLKKRKILENLCSSIFEKNYDLYLQHERMLDEEKAKRNELAEDFQKRMASVTEEINVLKEERNQALEEN